MITTHVLDTAAGRPGRGIAIQLERADDRGAWHRVGAGATDDDGRLRTLTPAGPVEPAQHCRAPLPAIVAEGAEDPDTVDLVRRDPLDHGGREPGPAGADHAAPCSQRSV